MNEIGETHLITTDAWFLAPDGRQYKAVFGTIKAVKSDEATLGLRTNRGSTNWYIEIGNMLVAGCQIHFCIRTETCNQAPVAGHVMHEGKQYTVDEEASFIYNADKG